MTDTTTGSTRVRPLSPWQSISPEAKARRRSWFLAVAVLFVVVSIPFGFPTGRDVITAWVLLLLLAACGGEWRTWRRAVVRDWLPLIAVLFLYDLLRGSADELGSRLVDLPAAEECCGFGGTFAVKNADTSVAMGADKARHVRETGAEVLVAGDSSCLMHIGGMLSRQQAGVRVMHLAEILAATETAAARVRS